MNGGFNNSTGGGGFNRGGVSMMGRGGFQGGRGGRGGFGGANMNGGMMSMPNMMGMGGMPMMGNMMGMGGESFSCTINSALLYKSLLTCRHLKKASIRCRDNSIRASSRGNREVKVVTIHMVLRGYDKTAESGHSLKPRLNKEHAIRTNTRIMYLLRPVYLYNTNARIHLSKSEQSPFIRINL